MFAGDLRNPEEVSPGSPIQLVDAHGEFLAFGYGNPNSKIAFRALSFSPIEENISILERLKIAWEKRISTGLRYSYRLCYSEADHLPGLIIDYYTVNGFQIFVCQILTAGMENLFTSPVEILKQLAGENIAVIIRNDVNIRKYEGLAIEKPRVLLCPVGLNLEQAEVLLSGPLDSKPISLKTNFLTGQKTGLFLDQSLNIRVLMEILARSGNLNHAPLRILDLCCYVGHWSAQLTNFLVSSGREVEVTLLDASEKSLRFAEENLTKLGAKVKVIRGDVLRDLKALPSKNFDVIISDPPAFVKNKNEISQGKHGYLKLNTEAFRLAGKNSLVVSCSCSGLLSEEDFNETLKKALKRSGREAFVIARGGHAPDHPVLPSFPEGNYLKMAIHSVL